MSRWDAGHFDATEARRYLEDVTEHFCQQLDDACDEEEPMQDASQNESMFMPNIAILLSLLERFPAPFPHSERIRHWRDCFLGRWEAGEANYLEPELRLRRLRHLEQTFARLLFLSEQHEQSME
ncbi:MAG: hypothetical protein RBU37_17920 [Myxococcota bacterium]|jgi:hypothetical protein|nr:hypothetical protein [Myxococcota bacterium]